MKINYEKEFKIQQEHLKCMVQNIYIEIVNKILKKTKMCF